MGVAYRERVAVDTVARLELPLVVDRPHVVCRRGDERRRTGMLGRPSRAALLGESMPGHQRCRRARGGPTDTGMALCEVRQELARAPAGMRAARFDDQLLGLHVCGGVLGEAGAALLGERFGTSASVALDPFVDSGPGDGVALGQISDGVESGEVIGDEQGALHERVGGLKGHGEHVG